MFTVRSLVLILSPALYFGPPAWLTAPPFDKPIPPPVHKPVLWERFVPHVFGVAVSPDGKWVAVNAHERNKYELLLMERSTKRIVHRMQPASRTGSCSRPTVSAC